MLIDSKLPKQFWAEAANYAVYIKNRTLSNLINTTPNEKFTKKKQNVKHLKIFGSLAYYWLAKSQRNDKLSNTSNPGIFVGFDNLTNHMKIFCINKQEMVIIRDEKIIESKLGSKLLKSKDTTNSNFPVYITEITKENNKEGIHNEETNNEEIEEINNEEIEVINEQFEEINDDERVEINEVEPNTETDENEEPNTETDENEEYSESEDSYVDDGKLDTTARDPNFRPSYEINENNDNIRRSERLRTKQLHRTNVVKVVKLPESH